jgi:MFS family permease
MRMFAGDARALMFVATGLAMLGNYYVYDSIGPVADLLARQLGFSDVQIGSLNAVYSLPNVFLVLVGGVLVDRFSARLVVFWTTAICLAGAALTAIGSYFPVMVLGRFLFGVARKHSRWRLWWRWRSGSWGAPSHCAWP